MASDLSIQSLIEQIQENAADLSVASFYGCELGDAQAELISAALVKNTRLKKLNLSKNNIGLAGAESLARALEDNQALESLDLSHNDIPRDGAAAFANSLRFNKSLKEIIFYGNNIAPEMIDDIDALLASR